jgi:23S rRNA pseudouridine1911/1915/1917 synthase
MTEPATHEFTLDADSELRLDLLLARELGTSRTHAATLIANGNVTVGNKREKASYRPESGDRIVVVMPAPPSREVLAEDIPLDVVFEDEHVMVVDKPAGLVVHPAAGNWSGTLLNGILFRDPTAAALPRAGIVHRLDKDTSGLMVIGRTLAAVTALVRAIAARDVPSSRASSRSRRSSLSASSVNSCVAGSITRSVPGARVSRARRLGH